VYYGQVALRGGGGGGVGAAGGAAGGAGAPAATAPSPWQEWHKDYGLFTAVSAPMYWQGEGGGAGGAAAAAAAGPAEGGAEGGAEGAAAVGAGAGAGGAPPPAPPGAGLHVLRSRGGSAVPVHLQPGCLGVQAGEAAQILSGGRIVAAPHCVSRPPGAPSCRRATFVVFCQPPAEQPLLALGGAGGRVLEADEDPSVAAALGGLLPPLRARWAGEAPPSFTQFGRNTVAAYFGKQGTQRQRKA
jgi:hypothetical protein